MEIFYAVISGILVFLIGQYTLIMFIKPYQEYKEIKAKVSYVLMMYKNIFSNPLILNQDIDVNVHKHYSKVSNKVRKTASSVRAFIEEVPLIHFGIPNKEKLNDVACELIYLSNSVFHTSNFIDTIQENDKAICRIRKTLNLYTG